MAKDCEKQANGNKKIRLKQEKAKSLLGDFFTHRVKQNDEFERFIDAWRAEKTYSFELYVSAPVVGQVLFGFCYDCGSYQSFHFHCGRVTFRHRPRMDPACRSFRRSKASRFVGTPAHSFLSFSKALRLALFHSNFLNIQS